MTAARAAAAAFAAAVAWAATAAVPEERFVPPVLPEGRDVVVETSAEFLAPPVRLNDGVTVATAPPTVEFRFYPGQEHAGTPWSGWGDGVVFKGRHYSAIGDHRAPRGTVLLHEYDPATKRLRVLVDVRRTLEQAGAIPAGMDYSPGKLHGRIDPGGDGWLYYSTHRGSARTVDDAHGYRGDWILRTDPATGTTEVVAAQPVARHSIPASLLDPDRMVFYGGTAPGKDAAVRSVQFLAYDVAARRLVRLADDGPDRCLFLARSTGRVYFVAGSKTFTGPLMRYDPARGGPPEPVGGEIGLRAATQETPQGIVYTVSKDPDATLWAFDTRTERIRRLGPAKVAAAAYVASLDADPSGRFLYYTAGAHGDGVRDGAPLVQYDVRTGSRKVIAFLAPRLRETCGYVPIGSFGSAVGGDGACLYVTWNGHRAGAAGAWDVCGLTVVHVPESERR